MNELDELRQKIGPIDEQILKLFAERFSIVREVGKIKKKNNLPFFDEKQWQIVLTRAIGQGENLGLKKEFIEKVFNAIHDQALKIEEE